jgi:hypothetical protein
MLPFFFSFSFSLVAFLVVITLPELKLDGVSPFTCFNFPSFGQGSTLSGLSLQAIACVDIFDGGYSHPPNSGFIYSHGLTGEYFTLHLLHELLMQQRILHKEELLFLSKVLSFSSIKRIL